MRASGIEFTCSGEGRSFVLDPYSTSRSAKLFFLLIAFLFTCATGTMSPKITTRTIALARNSVVRGLYTVYSGSAPLALTNVNETSVGIAVTTGVDATMKDEFRKLNAL